MDPKATLITTLGGQPQKVTFLLDLLLARGEEIDQVAVVYISSYQRTQNAIQLLRQNFRKASTGSTLASGNESLLAPVIPICLIS